MRLFKYVSPQRVDILEKERIAFTPPARFTDPFEMRLGLSLAARREFKRRLFKEVDKRAEQEVPGYRQLTARQRRKGRKQETRSLNLGAISNNSFQAAIERESQRIGVLCLCAINDEKLMWDHCANGFHGFVIEFDSDDDEFKKLGALWKVEYVDEPPAFDYSQPIPDFFRFKSKHYGYEREYRILRPIDDCTHEKGKDNLDLHFRPLARSCVKAVYLGHRMEKRVHENILRLLQSTSASKFDAVPSARGYTISFHEIK